MKKFLLAVLQCSIFTGVALAGSGIGGGGLGVQLQEVAMSETLMSAKEIHEVLGIAGDGVGFTEKTIDSNSDQFASLAESSTGKPAGILIKVNPSDFALIAKDAAGGHAIVYRDAEARAASANAQTSSVTLKLVEDPSITIVVRNTDN